MVALKKERLKESNSQQIPDLLKLLSVKIEYQYCLLAEKTLGLDP